MVFNKDCWVGNQDIHSWPGSATDLLWDLGASHFTSLDLSLFAKKKKNGDCTNAKISRLQRETKCLETRPSTLTFMTQGTLARPLPRTRPVGWTQPRRGCLAPRSRALQPRASSLIPLGLAFLLSVRCRTPAQLLLSRLTLCNPKDWNPPVSSVHGILQARILPFPSPGDLPHLGSNPGLPRCRFFTI